MRLLTRDLEVALRPMAEADIPAVLEVENKGYPFPWTEGIFRDCLGVGYQCWVLRYAGGVLGYGVMSVAAGECQILNLCIHTDFRRRGLGRSLLRHLLQEGRARRADMASLEVRASNDSALGLYTLEGFCEVGVRRGYYPAENGREDAIILARTF